MTGTFGVGHHLLDFFYSREHRGELDKLRLRHVRDDLGESSFARAGWSPEDQGAGVVTLDVGAQRLARCDEMFLTYEFAQRAWTHAVGQRTGAVCRTVTTRDGLEQTHWTALAIAKTKIFPPTDSVAQCLGGNS